MQARIWGNITPVQEVDRAVGRALIEFGRMIEGGRAFGHPPAYRTGDFPANDPVQAAESMRRAGSQRAKGRLTDAELTKVVRRCTGVITRGY